MKATKLLNRIEYERGVTDGGRAFHGLAPYKNKGTRSYLAGFDRGREIEQQKATKAECVEMLNKSA